MRRLAIVLLLGSAGGALAAAVPPPVVNDGYGDYLLVPAGEILLGDNFAEGDPDEVPVHAVTVDAFYVGKHEVTNNEYARFVSDAGYQTREHWEDGGFGEYGSSPRHWHDPRFHGGGLPGNEMYPVVGVSWFEAMAYARWLSAKTGRAYRLPTEAEWEKAARGTDQRRFAWGNEIDGSLANYEHSGDPAEPGLTPVGFFDGSLHDGFQTGSNASPAGAFDMIGNVWEWCLDWYSGSDAYATSEPANPRGPVTGSARVLRGGGWVDSAYYQQ